MKADVLNRVLEVCKEKSTSETQFAKQIGANQKTINQQLKGERSLSLDTVISILSTFEDISAEWLLRGQGEMFVQQEKKNINNEKPLLTKKERLHYLLLLKILCKLRLYEDVNNIIDPHEDNDESLEKCRNLITVLQDGYTYHYDELLNLFLPSQEISVDEIKLVRSILGMYKSFISSANYHEKSNEYKKTLVFPGFDGNDILECNMLFYTKYLFEKTSEFEDVNKLRMECNVEINSHREMLPQYKRMLCIFNRISESERNRMTEKDIEKILNA